MKCAAIISEYNPFHEGHKYQIDLLRAQGFDTVIAVMSGSVVQRGEVAITDKFTRARAAVWCGVDLVAELPAPFSCMSGEYFAKAGVTVAEALGADALSFGSECGDIELLRAHARKKRIAGKDEGAARKELADTAFLSNDLLGIEYLRAIEKLGASIMPITHKRIGGEYNSQDANTFLPSASAIRASVRDGRISELEHILPEKAYSALLEGTSLICDVKTSEELFSAALLLFLRFTPKEELASFAFMNGGIASRIKKAAEIAKSAEEMYSLASTKVYTNSRIRRASICALCRIPDSARWASPEYISLLAANMHGREYLSHTNPALPVLSTVREKRDFESFEYEKRFDTLFETVKRHSGKMHLCLTPPSIL